MAERPVLLLLALGLGCGSKPDAMVTLPADNSATASRRDEPPVPLNADNPIRYPEALARQRIGGTVILRLFLDSAGRVVADSTAIQESSGYPALDSAARSATPQLRYAPALRNGAPVAVSFLQPINFRAPSSPP